MYTEDGDALLGPRNLQLHAVIPGQYRGSTIGGSRHKYHFCRGKTFCREKHVFVTTKHVFYRDKSILVTTKLLLRHNYVCRSNHVFVTTKVYLSHTEDRGEKEEERGVSK